MNYKSNRPCIVCGIYQEDATCFHHIYTRKAYPEHKEKPWNMISVCQKHHNEFHNKGNSYMCQKYDTVRRWFKDNNWQEINKKYVNLTESN